MDLKVSSVPEFDVLVADRTVDSKVEETGTSELNGEMLVEAGADVEGLIVDAD